MLRTRSGPKIPAAGLLEGLIFRLVTNVFIMANMSYLPNFRSLEPPHGQEEAPVVHGLGHGHHGDQVLRIHTGTAMRASKPSETSSRTASAPRSGSVVAVFTDGSSSEPQIGERENSN